MCGSSIFWLWLWPSKIFWPRAPNYDNPGLPSHICEIHRYTNTNWSYIIVKLFIVIYSKILSNTCVVLSFLVIFFHFNITFIILFDLLCGQFMLFLYIVTLLLCLVLYITVLFNSILLISYFCMILYFFIYLFIFWPLYS
jgi:hypothetical protein